MGHKILVCDKIAPEGLEILGTAGEVTALPKAPSEAELVEMVAPYEAIVVRSATKITAPVFDAARALRIVGRAGVGVDNIDVAAATAHGVIVINSPEGNTIAAAEHAVALLLSLTRNVPQASASTKAGEWRKSEFMGTEVYQKALGIIGVGKIGSIVAQRCRGLGMNVLGYDPYLSAERARQLGIEKAELDDLLARSDFVTIHAAKTPETEGMIGADELAKMKPTARLVNCARGGIVNETALYEALDSQTIAGAALDVFAQEPPGSIPLFELPNVVATPHLGASTREAQEKVAVDVAEQIVDVLRGGQARTPVNVPAVASEVVERLQPWMDLARQMGCLQAHLHRQAIARVQITYAGDLADLAVAPVTPHFLVGLLSPQLEQTVNIVNARLVAEQRGIQVEERKTGESLDYVSLLTAEVESDGQPHTVSGTLFGRSSDPRIVFIDGYRLDVIPQGRVLLTWHYDRPGFIGRVGTLLGSNDINIAGMQVGREHPGGKGIMALRVDHPIPPHLVQEIDTFQDALYSILVDFGAG